MVPLDQFAVGALNLRFGGGGEKAQLVVGLRQLIAVAGGFLRFLLLLLLLLFLVFSPESIGVFVCSLYLCAERAPVL